MMTIKQLKSFLDSDDFILFATTEAKEKQQLYLQIFYLFEI